jgi:hypothetical protein
MKPSILILTALTGGATMAPGRLEHDVWPQLTHPQARLYQRAGRGPALLRDLIFIWRGIVQLGVARTTAAVHQERAACKKQSAGVAPQLTLNLGNLHDRA